jgi:hypothetical protein
MIKLSENGQLPLPVGFFIILLQPTQLIDLVYGGVAMRSDQQ